MTKLTNTQEQQEEAPQKPAKRQIFAVIASPFKVIFSPFKAFKEIAQNPDVKGLALIVGLVLLATAGAYYAHSSKVFLGVPPKQSVPPELHTYSDAYVYVTAFGNYTFQSSQPYVMNYTFVDETPLIEQSFFMINATNLLTQITPVTTTANATFYQTTAKLSQPTTEVGNFTLTIEFFSDTRPKISMLLTKATQWDLGNFTINWFIRSPYTYLANITTAIDLSSKTTLSFLQANVSRAELGNTNSTNNWVRSVLFDWSDYGNATLYGGQYTPLLDSGSWLNVVFNVNDNKVNATTMGLTYSSLLATDLSSNILPILTQTALLFIFNWVIYAGILLLVMRAFGEKQGTWRRFFVLIGYAFSIIIIQWTVGALLIATLPEVHLQITLWPPTGKDAAIVARSLAETWGPTLSFRALTFLTFTYINFIDIWLVLLSVVAVRAFSATVWRQAIMISTTAFLVRFFLRFFLGF